MTNRLEQKQVGNTVFRLVQCLLLFTVLCITSHVGLRTLISFRGWTVSGNAENRQCYLNALGNENLEVVVDLPPSSTEIVYSLQPRLSRFCVSFCADIASFFEWTKAMPIDIKEFEGSFENLDVPPAGKPIKAIENGFYGKTANSDTFIVYDSASNRCIIWSNGW